MVTHKGPPGVNLGKKENKIYFNIGLLNNVDTGFINSVQKFWTHHYGRRV